VALLNTHALASFTAACMRKTTFGDSAFIICLDSGTAIEKEYRHLPAKPAELRKFAALEAETVLKDSPENYYIETLEYGHAELTSGRLKAALFAVPKELITSLAVEFRQAGLKVLKICPMLSGLLSSCRTVLGLIPKNQECKGNTVVVIDVGYENVRIILFADGEPVFLKEFDSVWPDILETLHRDAGCSYEEALREMKRPGFLLSAGNASFGESITSMIGTLLETAFAEIVRNMRVVLSAERLEPGQVIVCGALASHPDFVRYFDSLALDIPCVNAEEASKAFQSYIGVEDQAMALGFRARDFLTLNGMLSSHGTINFLQQERERVGSCMANRVAMILLCVSAAALIVVEPIRYSQALSQNQADESALASPQIVEIKKLEAQKQQLENQYSAIQNDETLLENQKSQMEEAVNNLRTQLQPQVSAITSVQINGGDGTISLVFVTKNLEQFNNARSAISSAGYFEVPIPFNATRTNDGSYQCSATLKIKNFKTSSKPSADSGKNTAVSSQKGS
jgi:Tfp pilus assembly PilM family ATPase/Tfp pilus assembly protein PilN